MNTTPLQLAGFFLAAILLTVALTSSIVWAAINPNYAALKLAQVVAWATELLR
jgi:hypothetical protein